MSDNKEELFRTQQHEALSRIQFTLYFRIRSYTEIILGRQISYY